MRANEESFYLPKAEVVSGKAIKYSIKINAAFFRILYAILQ